MPAQAVARALVDSHSKSKKSKSEDSSDELYEANPRDGMCAYMLVGLFVCMSVCLCLFVFVHIMCVHGCLYVRLCVVSCYIRIVTLP